MVSIRACGWLRRLKIIRRTGFRYEQRCSQFCRSNGTKRRFRARRGLLPRQLPDLAVSGVGEPGPLERLVLDPRPSIIAGSGGEDRPELDELRESEALGVVARVDRLECALHAVGRPRL